MKHMTRTVKGHVIGKTMLTLAVLVILLIVFALMDLSWAGSKTFSLKEVWDALCGNGTWASDNIIIRQNLPRVLTALFVGAGLAVTGCVMQAVFRNPLATPYILGLSSGASVGAAIAIMFSIPFIPLAIAQPVMAFVMCLLTTLLVYTISRSGGGMVRTETLVLAGVAISSLFSAIVSFLTYIAPDDKMGDIVFWSLGSLGKTEMVDVLIIGTVVIVGIILMLTQSRNLNAMMIGDSHAMDLGVDVRKVRIGLLVISSLVVAASVSFVGTIGFVGLVVPHILRMILGPDNRIIIPMSIVGGATFLMIGDWTAHAFSTMFGVLPIGVVTALVGAPFFIYLLCRKKKEVGW